MKTSSNTLVVFALTALLQGCALAPGQHLSSHDLAHGVAASESQLELVPITPKLLAMERAGAEAAAIPAALLDYRPQPYRIGAGDTLYITVWDHPELTSPAGPQQATVANGRLVRSDGTLFYPYVGALKVAGMTIEQLRRAITDKLNQVLERPQVDVSVIGYNSQHVLLQGAFVKTEPLPITATPMTLVQALGTATINTQEANLSGLVLVRDGHDYHLDLDSLNRRKRLAQDIYLKPGDRLFMPYNDRQEAYVLGEVLRPQAITFKTTDLSLAQALGRAGGLEQTTAKGRAIYVIRGVHDLEQEPAAIFQLDAKSPVAFVLADQFKVKPGDIVFVGAAGITRWSRFVTQLLPFSGLISSAASTHTDLRN